MRYIYPKRKEKKLPEVLSKQAILAILNKTANLKHKTIIALAYSAGLRSSEITNLKLSDIDSKRMIIHIKNAKGKKDRLLPLSSKLLVVLRMYFTTYKPKKFLFEGLGGSQYSQSSLRKVVKAVAKKAKMPINVTVHTLRHSYATHLLESGTDIRYIQQLLGHNSIKTTQIYTKVSNTKLQSIKSPFDTL